MKLDLIHNLNILDTNIQDQKWNNTRFAIIVPKKSIIKYYNKSNKVSILFETKDIPASLYKCLWAFATNDINLTKIESMPNLENPFSYLFYIDFEWKLLDKKVENMFKELNFFVENVKILGEY